MDKRSSDDRAIEETWRSIAVRAALAGPLLLFIAAMWIFAAPNEEAMLVRVNILSPFGVLHVALITFCTVVWRGLVATRQVETAAKQLTSMEENNLALLLQKGAELVSDFNNRSAAAAGIASLSAVGRAPESKFAEQVMDLLADVVQWNSDRMDDNLFASAANALLDIHRETGRLSHRQLSFEAQSEPAEDAQQQWRLVGGVRVARYRDGYFFGEELLRDSEVANTSYVFFGVSFHECMLDLTAANFIGCTLVRCSIFGVDPERLINCDFRDCDFSACEFRNAASLPNLRAGGNWYDPRRPPTENGKAIKLKRKLYIGRGSVPPEPDPDEDDGIFFT